MAKFTIYSKDGATVRHTGEPQYSGSYMGVDYVEFRSVSSLTPIDWQIGDYVDYYRTGMRYKLYSLPMPKKVARKGDHGASFEYSNVQLHGATKELEIAPFRDLVPKDNKIHFSTRPEVSTYEDVYGIARRIQECMDDIFPNRWRIEVYDTDDADLLALFGETKEYSVSNGSCLDALSQIYDTWKNVGWIHTYDADDDVDVITIGRANVRDEDNTSDSFTYGVGNGLTSIKKAAANEGEFATRLYVYGSERNIQTRYYNGLNILDKDSVDIRNLMLPIEKWGKTNGLPDARKAYLQAEDSIIEKYGLIPRTVYFDGNENEEIYPSITGLTMSQVRQAMIDAGQGSSQYLPGDYDYRIDEIGHLLSPLDSGSKEDTEANMTFVVGLREMGFDVAKQGKLTNEGYATISMKSGACAGREFKVKKYNGPAYGNESYGKRTYLLERNWDESIGMGFPNTTYPIKSGDEFVLLDIPMPDFYIALSEDRLLDSAEKMLSDYTKVSAFYEPSINAIKIKEGGKLLRAGMFMQVYDEDIIDTADNKDYVLIDTLTIDEKSDLPKYKVTLREQKRSARTYGTLEDMIEDAKEVSRQDIRRERQYTDRRFRSAQQTLELLQAAFTNFSEGISPVTVRTMAMLIGDESLQFKFTASRLSLTDVPCPIFYNESTKQMTSVPASLIHMTLGIDVVTAPGAMKASDYKGWDIPAFDSAILEDSAKSYYVYVKASQTDTNAEYFLSDAPIDMEGVAGYYHFLVGILNSEYNGSRDFVTLYGFTEVLPGQITTDVIRSADGKTYFDLSKGEIGGRITFTNNGGKKESVADFAEAVQDQIDGVVENWSEEGEPTTTNVPASNWTTDADKIAHINDTYVNIEEYVDDETTPTAGHAWRWCKCLDDTITDYVTVTDKDGNTFRLHWHPIADSDAVRALKEAAEARRVSNENVARLDVLYDDGLISQGELDAIYAELAFVVNDKIDIDNSVQKYGLEDSDAYAGYLNYFNLYDTVLETISSATSEQFPLSVSDLGLVWKRNAYYANRASILKEISNKTKGAIYKVVSDTEHLVKTFEKGSTTVSGGVVMTDIVAVRDTDETNIEAFLNGSDYGADSEHGKLLIAAGIPDGTTELEGRAKEANTRVYEDGHIETNDIKATGGVFSNVKVLGSSRSPFMYGATYVDDEISDNHFMFQRNSASVVTLKSDISESGRIMQFAGNYMISCKDGYIYDHGKSYYNKHIYVGPFVITNGGVDIGYECVTLVAVPNEEWNKVSWIVVDRRPFGESAFSDARPHGVFAGLRPNVRVVTTAASATSPHQLTDYDHTVIVDINTSGMVVYIKLPTSPKNGQRYEIMTTDQEIDLNINVGTVTVVNINGGATNTSGTVSFSAAYRRRVTFIYESSVNKWYLFYKNLTA